MVYEISRVSDDGAEVNLHVPGTNLKGFRVRTETLNFIERKPPARTTNPFTDPEPTFDAGEVLERIRTVQQENVKRLKDDIAILTKYLQTQDAPKAVLGAPRRAPQRAAGESEDCDRKGRRSAGRVSLTRGKRSHVCHNSLQRHFHQQNHLDGI
jgi:hypothetical protein